MVKAGILWAVVNILFLRPRASLGAIYPLQPSEHALTNITLSPYHMDTHASHKTHTTIIVRTMFIIIVFTATAYLDSECL